MYCTSLICLWNIFFSHRKRQLLWKYPNPETVIVPCINVSRMPNRRTSQSKMEDIVRASICSNKGKHIHPVRHAKHPKQILQTKHTFTTFDSAGEGGGSGSLCRVRIFISSLLPATMHAGLFIYVPRDKGHNIYFKVFDGQNIYFKKLPAPPPQSTAHPLTKKGTSYNHSPKEPTAILNTWWPCSTGFGLVGYKLSIKE